jgi:hypothetical protein
MTATRTDIREGQIQEIGLDVASPVQGQDPLPFRVLSGQLLLDQRGVPPQDGHLVFQPAHLLPELIEDRTRIAQEAFDVAPDDVLDVAADGSGRTRLSPEAVWPTEMQGG